MQTSLDQEVYYTSPFHISLSDSASMPTLNKIKRIQKEQEEASTPKLRGGSIRLPSTRKNKLPQTTSCRQDFFPALSPHKKINLASLLIKRKTTPEIIAITLLGARNLSVATQNSPQKNIIRHLLSEYPSLRKNHSKRSKIHKAFSLISMNPTDGQLKSDGERILDLFHEQMKPRGFFLFLVDRLSFEIKLHKGPKQTLFRIDSFATLLFCQYQKEILGEVLDKLLNKKLKKYRKFSEKKLKLNDLPKKQLKTNQRRHQSTAENLFKKLIKLLRKQKKISKKKHNLPFEKLTRVYASIFIVTKKRYGKKTAQKQVLSFLLFRLVSPAIMSPTKYLSLKKWAPKSRVPLKYPAMLVKGAAIAYRETSVPLRAELSFAEEFLLSDSTQGKMKEISILLTQLK